MPFQWNCTGLKHIFSFTCYSYWKSVHLQAGVFTGTRQLFPWHGLNLKDVWWTALIFCLRQRVPGSDLRKVQTCNSLVLHGSPGTLCSEQGNCNRAHKAVLLPTAELWRDTVPIPGNLMDTGKTSRDVAETSLRTKVLLHICFFLSAPWKILDHLKKLRITATQAIHAVNSFFFFFFFCRAGRQNPFMDQSLTCGLVLCWRCGCIL